MDLNTFLAAYDALKTAQNSDEPATKNEAKDVATALTEGIETLSEWAADFEAAVSQLRDKAEELIDADKEDRPDYHSEFVAEAETVIDHLVDIGVTPATIHTLRAAAL